MIMRFIIIASDVSSFRQISGVKWPNNVLPDTGLTAACKQTVWWLVRHF